MGREDWYRRTTWTPEDEREFFERLKRSRGTFHKAQYLRIQALHLQGSHLYREALNLLDMLVKDYPDESQLSSAQLQRAECLWELGDAASAFDAFQEALRGQARYPNIENSIELSFAEHFCDYNGGEYREMLLEQILKKLSTLKTLHPDDKQRYGSIVERLYVGLSRHEELEKWRQARGGKSDADAAHYWDVIAQRQFDNVVAWLRDFIDPQFRERIWQKGTGAGQFYEESAAEFFDDFSVDWLIENGLARLNAPVAMIDALRAFANRYKNFDDALPMWIDAVQLEANPAFVQIVEEARSLLETMERSRREMRQVEDDIPPFDSPA